jgi:hypothetical protein
MAPLKRLNSALIEPLTKTLWETKKNRIVTLGEGGENSKKKNNIIACFTCLQSLNRQFIEP